MSRRIGPDDQHHTRIDVTPRGEQAIRAIREILQEVEAEWSEKLGARRFAQRLRLVLGENILPMRSRQGSVSG